MARHQAYNDWLYKHNRVIVLAAAGGQCHVPGCHRPATTADHITPLCDGGSHHLANLRACCPYHNSAAAARTTNERRTVGRRSRPW